MSREHYELKIESGISGAAMSLFKETEIIDQWIDDAPTGKSDFLLETIALLLERNKIKPGNLESISFAGNTRSQTAYKIAVSTFKGISLVNGTKIILKDLFDAVSAYFTGRVREDFLIILQRDAERFEYAFFDKDRKMTDSAVVGLDDLPELFEDLLRRGKFTLLTSLKAESAYFEQNFKELNLEGIERIDLGRNLSVYL